MLRKQSRMLTLCLTGMLLFSAELTISAQNASAEKNQKAAAPKVLSPEEQLKEKLRKDYTAAASRKQLEYDIAELNADQLREKAEQYARSASQAYQGGEYQKAIDCYLKAIDILKRLSEKTNDQQIAQKIDNCRQAISNAYYYWAEKMYLEAQNSADANQFAQAIQKCEEAAKIWPPAKPKLQEAIALYKKYQKSAEYRTKVSPESVDPGKQARLYSIDVLMKQGEIFAADKQWDKARDKYEDVLAIDPFNVKAIEAIRLLNIRIYRAGKQRTNTTRAEYIAESIWKEVSPLTPRLTGTGTSVAENESPVKKEENKNSIQSKLKNIVLPHIDFDEIELPVVLRHLRQRSKERDPEKIGVNIFLLPEENKAPGANAQQAAQQTQKKKSEDDEEEETSSSGRKVSLVADSMTLGQALTYICHTNNLRMKIEKYAVVIAPPGVPLEQMETRIYPMEKDVIDRQISKAAEGKVDESGGTQINAQSLFTNIPFDSGAQVIYDPTISRLIVTNTADNLQKVEEMIKEMNVVDPQVLIQAKFVEVQLNDLEELGFEYLFSRQNSNVNYVKDTDLVQYKEGDPLPDYTINIYQPQTADERKTGPSANWYKYSGITYTKGKDDPSRLESSFYYQKAPVQSKSVSFGENSVPIRTVKNMADQTNTQDTFAQFTHYNKYGYKVQATMNALDQADSTDLLACPRVTTMNGYEAVIAMVTEMYFPSDWNEAEVGTLSTGAGNGSVPLITPSTPQFDDPERLGIELRVKPQVDATDNYTITLPIQPVIRSFIGWVDYSYQLTTQSNGEPFVYTNVLKMPIFENRSVDTLIQCYDGETIVLGGVMKDETTSFNDQYPILGNLPLIGRLFQSKAKSAKRSNLLIFLTCRLINPDGSPVREREMRGLPPFRQ